MPYQAWVANDEVGAGVPVIAVTAAYSDSEELLLALPVWEVELFADSPPASLIPTWCW